MRRRVNARWNAMRWSKKRRRLNKRTLRIKKKRTHGSVFCMRPAAYSDITGSTFLSWSKRMGGTRLTIHNPTSAATMAMAMPM